MVHESTQRQIWKPGTAGTNVCPASMLIVHQKHGVSLCLCCLTILRWHIPVCNNSAINLAWSICVCIPVWAMYLKPKQSAERPYKLLSSEWNSRARCIFARSAWLFEEVLFGLPSHFMSLPLILIINTWMGGWLTKLANTTAQSRRMPFHDITSVSLSSMSRCTLGITDDQQLPQNQDG